MVLPFFSAPRVFSVGCSHIRGNSSATALPAYVHRLPGHSKEKGFIEIDLAEGFGEQENIRDRGALRYDRATFAAPSVESERSSEVSKIEIATGQLRYIQIDIVLGISLYQYNMGTGERAQT